MKTYGLFLLVLCSTLACQHMQNEPSRDSDATSDALGFSAGLARFGDVELHNVRFRNEPVSGVLRKVNKELAGNGLRVRINFTPPEYVKPEGYPRLEHSVGEIVDFARNQVSEIYLQSAEDIEALPRFSFHSKETGLFSFLSALIKSARLDLHMRFYEHEIVLAPGPAVYECRAYAFEPGLAQVMAAEQGKESLITLLASPPWMTNYMRWVESEAVLLRLSQPEELDRFEERYLSVDGVVKLPRVGEIGDKSEKGSKGGHPESADEDRRGVENERVLR